MTRPIDADTLIDSLNIRSVTYNCIINKCIEDAPTIDAVEVVRCKDCIFYKETLSVKGFCHNHGSIVSPNAFCSYGSYGKHREDGEA